MNAEQWVVVVWDAGDEDTATITWGPCSRAEAFRTMRQEAGLCCGGYTLRCLTVREAEYLGIE